MYIIYIYIYLSVTYWEVFLKPGGNEPHAQVRVPDGGFQAMYPQSSPWGFNTKSWSNDWMIWGHFRKHLIFFQIVNRNYNKKPAVTVIFL